ncbi:MAG: hypothetical protein EPN85_04550 [Bacteroidetes bacterium]|nr:MAG: hypothetical protein EPN85_04550 [Bacteroidota bacterium]
MNYELDSYLDAIKDFPNPEVKLETTGGLAFHMKTDIFKRKMWYAYENERGVFIELSVDRVKEVIALNKAGKKPDELRAAAQMIVPKFKEPDYQNVVGQDSISRFDRGKNKGKGGGGSGGGRNRNRNRNRR